MEVNDGGEGPAEHPEAGPGRPPVHPLAQPRVRQPPHPVRHRGQVKQLMRAVQVSMEDNLWLLKYGVNVLKG